MYLIRAHGAALKQVWKKRLRGRTYIYSRVECTYIRFLQTTCVALVVINLIWICYNMDKTTNVLMTLQETHDLRNPREWEASLDDV